MRVFSAIFPPHDIVHDLSRAVTQLLPQFPALQWNSPMLRHLQLTYFGNFALTDTGRLNDVMHEFAAQRDALTLRLEGAGATPEPVAALGVPGT